MTGGGITKGLNRAMKQKDGAGRQSASNPIPLQALLSRSAFPGASGRRGEQAQQFEQNRGAVQRGQPRMIERR